MFDRILNTPLKITFSKNIHKSTTMNEIAGCLLIFLLNFNFTQFHSYRLNPTPKTNFPKLQTYSRPSRRVSLWISQWEFAIVSKFCFCVIKRIWENYSTSAPPKIIKNPCIFGDFRGNIDSLTLSNLLQIKSKVSRRSPIQREVACRIF